MKMEAQIGLFLAMVKHAVEENGVILVPRDESMRFLAERGMTVRELEGIILSLEWRDCFDGPEPDRDSRYHDWTVAEFCPTYDEEKIYLKLSVKVQDDRCKCLSVKVYTEREVA